MTPPLRHLLLTKYNAPFPGGSAAPGPKRGLDPAWLALRLRLFADWPLRSVRAQRTAPDGWLVFVDAETPEHELRRLADVAGVTAQLVPVAGDLTDERVGELVAARLGDEPALLVTSRLDSDDALAASYVARIQAQAPGARGAYINPRNGLQSAGGRILRRWDSSSPFLSFVEEHGPGRTPQTVLSIEHYAAHRRAPVRQLGGAPAWMQVLHGGNLANEVQGVPWSRRRAEQAMGFALPPADGADATPGPLRPAVAQVVHEARWRAARVLGR